jgi:hypothetical protein
MLLDDATIHVAFAIALLAGIIGLLSLAKSARISDDEAEVPSASAKSTGQAMQAAQASQAPHAAPRRGRVWRSETGFTARQMARFAQREKDGF